VGEGGERKVFFHQTVFTRLFESFVCYDHEERTVFFHEDGLPGNNQMFCGGQRL
jgi:hypothetical protein